MNESKDNPRKYVDEALCRLWCEYKLFLNDNKNLQDSYDEDIYIFSAISTHPSIQALLDANQEAS